MTTAPRMLTRAGVMFIAIMIAAQIIIQSTPLVHRWWTEGQTPESWYAMKFLAYERTDGRLLILQRTASVGRDLDTITWSRSLWCESPEGEMTVFSSDTPITTVNYRADDLVVEKVFYGGAFPTDRLCEIRSTAVFTIDGIAKQTDITTGRFTPGQTAAGGG